MLIRAIPHFPTSVHPLSSPVWLPHNFNICTLYKFHWGVFLMPSVCAWVWDHLLKHRRTLLCHIPEQSWLSFSIIHQLPITSQSRGGTAEAPPPHVAILADLVLCKSFFMSVIAGYAPPNLLLLAIFTFSGSVFLSPLPEWSRAYRKEKYLLFTNYVGNKVSGMWNKLKK